MPQQPMYAFRLSLAHRAIIKQAADKLGISFSKFLTEAALVRASQVNPIPNEPTTTQPAGELTGASA